ncbi:MAG: choice-of-anchor D domain-containing protein [Polyangiaceae bacterium]
MKSTLLWIQALCLLVVALVNTACSDSESGTDGKTTVSPGTISVLYGTTALRSSASVNVAGATVGVPVASTFTIKNSGEASLTISGVVVSGADFTLSKSPEKEVKGGKSTSFEVTFAPSSAGTKTANISILSDSAEDFSFSVSGSATAAPAPLIVVKDGDAEVVAESVVGLANLKVGESTDRTFTIVNPGTADLHGFLGSSRQRRVLGGFGSCEGRRSERNDDVYGQIRAGYCWREDFQGRYLQ